MRQFSLTSSQANGGIESAIVDFQEDAAWKYVAEILYGPDWKEKLLPAEERGNAAQSDNEGATTARTDSDEDEDDVMASHLAPPSIQEYLASYVVPEDAHPSERSALNFLKRFVFANPGEESDSDESSAGPDLDAQGFAVEAEAEAKALFNDLSRHEKRAAQEILISHIENEDFRKNAITRDMILWLQNNNSSRNYLFYKADGLKALMDARDIAVASGRRKNIANMIQALAGVPGASVTTVTDQASREEAKEAEEDEDPEMTRPRMEAIKSVLKKSFMPRLKGKSRDYCLQGHLLEVPILKNWIKLAHGRGRGAVREFRGIHVDEAYTAGLAAKRNAVFAKDSIDFILVVKDPRSSSDESVAWGFEAKGRLTADTVGKEERHRQMMDPHIRIDATEMSEQISSVAERFQILHHAYVYNFPTVVLAIADNQGQMIRSLVVDFSTELKHKFGRVLQDLKKFTLWWAYPQLRARAQVMKIPEAVFRVAESIPTINGREALHGSANVWLALCKLPKPFPTFLRLIPGIYAFWNAVKGGSDTTTKLMDDCILRVPKAHLNTETTATTRLMMLNFVLIHRLIQAFSANPCLPYSSLRHYRDAASHRSTFHVTLLRCNQIFQQAVQDFQDENNPPPQTSTRTDEGGILPPPDNCMMVLLHKRLLLVARSQPRHQRRLLTLYEPEMLHLQSKTWSIDALEGY